jgi:hypothetical protein
MSDQKVDVVSYRASLEESPAEISDDSAHVSVEFIADFVG